MGRKQCSNCLDKDLGAVVSATPVIMKGVILCRRIRTRKQERGL